MEDDIPDSRPQMYLFGCTLKSDRREFKVDVEDDDTEHQLSLKAVCVGAEAEDELHVVEIEGLAFDGKATKVPLAALKPSVLPSLGLGGFEITPPVTFRLHSGSGPIYVSGQHFVSVKDSDDDEEENNTSPVKRPASMLTGKKPLPKKLKMDSDDDDEDDSDEDDDDDDDDDDSDEEDVKKQKKSAKAHPKKSPGSPGKKPKGAATGKQNGSPGKPGTSAVKTSTKDKTTPKTVKDKAPALSLADIKSKLASAAKDGKGLPKTEQKFENFAKSSFRVFDQKVIKELWNFLNTLKTAKKS